ncbi:MAG: SpoIIE family protein phosphatase [Ruminococcus sp.]|uniref:SpoIIE family protein phosphatase n=1 Tax=Ruminococcus sp. TaxID=41978 RepID=UPI002872B6B7|nr:SpoIIE family protein phosphatase [Ruminococcus sp.]MBQ3284775.1 SpoIIE family protein phosphatase [Ruminococcus sp.]
MKLIKKIRSNMSLSIIGGIVAMLLVFGFIVCIIGNSCFVSAFKDEYSTVTYHMADSAATFVNGDHLSSYLEDGETEEYKDTLQKLDVCCHKLNVSLIYVIQVDTSDYGRFVSIFNVVNNSVDDSHYTPWELGYQRDTTNDEYRQKYQAIYEENSPYETVFRMRTTDGQHPHITTLVPVRDHNGEVAGILCVQRPVNEMANAFMPYVILIAIGVFMMIAVVTLFTVLLLRNGVIKPVKKVSDEATRFAKENQKGEPLGDISRYEVILNLARSIDSMETDMVSYIENLTAATAEKERIGAELSIAATIQETTLPDEFPAFPDRSEFDIYASMTPAKMVGGDFYNFFFIDDDHLAMEIADVSGKGIPAALFMMITNILIQNVTKMGGTPAEILTYVNNEVCRRNRADMFVTVWLGILEISTGKLVSANAGHDDPAVYRRDGRFEIVKEKHGFVIGGMEGMRYKNNEITLNPGDKLFLYTDGVPEATDQNDEMFTVGRTIDALNEHKEEAPKQIIEGVRDSVSAFVGDAPQFDDMTMLCFELKEANEDSAE